MRLIGINGFKESGKDTTGRFIAEYAEDNGGSAQRRAFADKLKIMAALALGLEGEPGYLIALMDEAKERWTFTVNRHRQARGVFGPEARFVPTVAEPVTNFTGRQYLQWFGGHARTVFGDTFWIDQVLPHPVEHTPGADALDHRIQNDYSLRKFFDHADIGYVTDVRYPNEAERVLNLGGEVWEIVRPGQESDGHSSEQPLPRELVTVTINNDAGLDELRDKIGGLL